MLECIRVRDPIPEVVDDESRTTVRMTFEADALDGSTRVIGGTTDHVLTELSSAGEMVDHSMMTGLDPDVTHDAAVETLFVRFRVPLLALDEYARVEVGGEVAIDADGHGHVDLAWTTPEPASSRAGRGDSIRATF